MLVDARVGGFLLDALNASVHNVGKGLFHRHCLLGRQALVRTDHTRLPKMRMPTRVGRNPNAR
jgi:hypothetical protein